MSERTTNPLIVLYDALHDIAKGTEAEAASKAKAALARATSLLASDRAKATV